MTNNLFGKMVKELRIDNKLSQRALGERLGFCNQTISFWESGQREPDLDSLVVIANFFDVTVDYLLQRKNF